MLELYLATGNKDYLNIVQALSEKLKQSFKPQPEDSHAIFWSTPVCETIDTTYPTCYLMENNTPDCKDAAGNNYCRPADVSHSENLIFAISELNKAGIVFTSDDIAKLVYTFKNRIWDGNVSDPKFYDFPDKKLIPDGGRYAPWVMGSNLAAGWISLGSYDPTLNAMFMNIEDSQISNKGWLNKLAYYGELARNLSLIKSGTPEVITPPTITTQTNQDQPSQTSPAPANISNNNDQTSQNVASNDTGNESNTDQNITPQTEPSAITASPNTTNQTEKDDSLTKAGTEAKQLIGILIIALFATIFLFVLRIKPKHPKYEN